jgi:hypothetical protein
MAIKEKGIDFRKTSIHLVDADHGKRTIERKIPAETGLSQCSSEGSKEFTGMCVCGGEKIQGKALLQSERQVD